MFSAPEYVFKDGRLVVRDGKVVQVTWGRYHSVRPEYDRGIERELAQYFDRYGTIRAEHMRISAEEMAAFGHGAATLVHPCRRPA
jgi:formylmethanofuran dehydrogenase subunit A